DYFETPRAGGGRLSSVGLSCHSRRRSALPAQNSYSHGRTGPAAASPDPRRPAPRRPKPPKDQDAMPRRSRPRRRFPLLLVLLCALPLGLLGAAPVAPAVFAAGWEPFGFITSPA